MTDKQIEHVVEMLIAYTDRISKKEDATPIEVKALYKIASVLAEFAKLPY